MDDRRGKTEWERFKMNLIATHPHMTKEVLEMEDPTEREEGLAEPLNEEQMEEWVPLTALELGHVMDDLAGFGLKMS